MKPAILAILAALFVTTAAQANVVQSTLSWDIQQREPVGDLGSEVRIPSSGISKVYFFTRITDLKGQQVVHRWSYQGKSMAEVTLNIGADSWRTYSSKRLIPSWQGDWQVDVLLDGEVIHSHTFTLVTE